MIQNIYLQKKKKKHINDKNNKREVYSSLYKNIYKQIKKSNMKQYKELIKEKIICVKEKNTTFNKVKISSSKDAQEYARKFYFDDLEIYESFFIILLNKSNNTIGYAKISQGGIAGTVVDVKIICKYALDCLASGLILVHNHPSGNVVPSDSDKNITNKIKQALNIIDVNLLDHIIITEEKHLSFQDEGHL